MVIITYNDGRSTSAVRVPDGSPPYSQLMEERDRLIKENAKLIDLLAKNNPPSDLWEVVECVACGEALPCPTCKKYKPCCCK